jgi:ferritin-like metal-binding protein YciE
MTIKSMNDLFLHTLKDLYYAEKQIYKNLPKMAKNAKSAELRRAFEKHREETDGHIERLETIFEQCEVAPRAIRCARANPRSQFREAPPRRISACR